MPAKRRPSLKALKNRAWKLLSEYVRRKGADAGGTERCYTCGHLAHWKELQAGHAIGGRHNAVLLDEDIVRPQCVRCNVFQRGAYPVFTARLIRENGLTWFEEKLAGARQAVKFTRDDLERFIADYREKLAGLALK